jgi:diacylglycerol kinase (ATP)
MKKFFRSVNYASKGAAYLLKFERNARVHLAAAIAVFLAGWAFGVTNFELAAIFFAVILVFLAEIFNSAIEKTLDIVEERHDLRIAIVKDMAAAGVLLTAGGAVVVGLIIFVPYVEALWLG